MNPAIRMDPQLERRIAEKRHALDLQRPLPPAIVAKLAEDLRVRLTYHSNAIEGNTLDLGETQLVIAHGITIGGHTLQEHLEAINHAAAFSFVQDLAQRAVVFLVNVIGRAVAPTGGKDGDLARLSRALRR